MANTVTCNFYVFGKKDNSTAIPTGDGTIRTGELKTGFNLLAPVIKIRDTVTTVPAFNYVYIAKLSRYYFISSWTYDAGFWYASCECDVLASWKTAIGNLSLYVTRSASEYDGSILDGTYPTTAECTIIESTSTTDPFPNSGGAFVVGIVGGENSTGAISYYAMSEASFSALIGLLLGDVQYMNIDVDDMSEEIQKAFINPSKYIASCIWIPIDPGYIPGSPVGSIPVGWWRFPVGANKITPFSAKVPGHIALNVPKHPLAATRGKYLNLAPYSDYTVHFFPFGTFSIDPIRLQDESIINLNFLLDCCTGEGVLYITADGSSPIKIVNGKFGVPVPTGQISYDVSSFSGAAVAAGTTAAAGALSHAKEFFNLTKAVIKFGATDEVREMARELTPAATGILSSAAASLATVDHSGQMGSNLYNDVPIKFVGKFLDIVDDDNSHRGRPLCQNKTINTLSGYFQVAEADVTIPCTATERTAIEQYLLGGMFYE